MNNRDVNDWQVAGIERTVASMDGGESVAHEQVEGWVRSWGGRKELPAPKGKCKG
jgi:predicted transcriptional regulator